ncbi:MAG: hypothetical protein CYG60_21960 [Actinobacteria bacterium]|jgi:hypothetical protein|nr:hypothetical protein [Actinomycetota bacterium]PLS83453.1 MAG: hypothetical protein CYG60_21960 [Actinomycetota bacterium]
MQRSERTQALEEAVRHLESARTDPARIGELDFEDARVAGLVTAALSAAHAALSAATKRDNLVEGTPPNR